MKTPLQMPSFQNVDAPTLTHVLTDEESPILAARRARKEEDVKYREAARRISGGVVRDEVTVNRDANDTGAFVEVVIWIARREIE